MFAKFEKRIGCCIIMIVGWLVHTLDRQRYVVRHTFQFYLFEITKV